jgi:hypothetical protein
VPAVITLNLNELPTITNKCLAQNARQGGAKTINRA